MTEYPEDFANIAMNVLRTAKQSGIALVAHTMSCQNCERFNDPDMTVKMCPIAKVLNSAYRDAYDAAQPYMKIIEADMQTELQ
jgi:hypothetical protein